MRFNIPEEGAYTLPQAYGVAYLGGTVNSQGFMGPHTVIWNCLLHYGLERNIKQSVSVITSGAAVFCQQCLDNHVISHYLGTRFCLHHFLLSDGSLGTLAVSSPEGVPMDATLSTPFQAALGPEVFINVNVENTMAFSEWAMGSDAHATSTTPVPNVTPSREVTPLLRRRSHTVHFPEHEVRHPSISGCTISPYHLLFVGTLSLFGKPVTLQVALRYDCPNLFLLRYSINI